MKFFISVAIFMFALSSGATPLKALAKPKKQARNVAEAPTRPSPSDWLCFGGRNEANGKFCGKLEINKFAGSLNDVRCNSSADAASVNVYFKPEHKETVESRAHALRIVPDGAHVICITGNIRKETDTDPETPSYIFEGNILPENVTQN